MTETAKKPLTEAEKDQKKRKSLFTPCKSKRELWKWIRVYLDIDFPDCIVDPDSNSSPMDMVWQVYSKALANDDPSFNRVLYFSARAAYKTLGAAILEVLAVLHLNRDVAHMAALEGQSRKAQSYVKGFFSKKILRDFKVGNNLEQIDIARYYNKNTGINLNASEFKQLLPIEQDKYEEIKRYIKIVVCTMAGANCIDPGSKITMADRSFKLALEIKPGDQLLSFDIESQDYISTIVGETGLTVKSRIRITTEDGGVVTVSDDHPVFTNCGWTYARSLSLMDKLLDPALKQKTPLDNVGIDLDVQSYIPNPRSVLLGTILGDSCIAWPKNKAKVEYGKGPRLFMYHGKDQVEYAKFKAKALEPLDLGLTLNTYRSDRDGISIRSKTSSFLSEIYRLFYPEGKKTITKQLLNQIDAEALAYWLMDDGSGCPQKVGSRKDHCIAIATCCFSSEENQLIVDWLFEKWGYKATIETVSNQSKKVYLVVKFDLDSSRKISEDLDKYFHHTIKYKLPAPFRLIKAKCIICGTEAQNSGRRGFSWCSNHYKYRNTRSGRKWALELKALCTRSIKKIEHLEPASLIDIHIKTENENHRNFIVNNCILAHNSEHTSFMVVDEVDVVRDRAAYQQAKAIPDGMNGQYPITMLTSTRKFSFGLVQDEIDNAVDRDGDIKLHIKHWNIIDVTEKCHPERCLPEQPKIPIYVDEENLLAIGEKKYNNLTDDEKNKFIKDEGFQGCLSNCKLFSACRGRLYTIQKSKSKLLKKIDQVTNQFRNFKLEMAQAELLCKKPSKTGLIYSNLERSIHMKTAAQMAEMLLGEPVDPNFTKKQLITLLRERDDWNFFTGMDFGFSHFFAFATGAADGYRCFIIDAFGESNLMPDQIVNVCNNRIKYLNPTIFGDPEDPGMVATLKAAGFKMKKWIKGPGSLITGIDTVKLKLREPMGEATLFFLAGDPGVEELFKYLSVYHWKLDPDGETLSNDPDDKDDDYCDALRYLVMNKFSAGKSRGTHMSKNDEKVEQSPTNSDIWTKENMYQKILEENGISAGVETDNSGSANGVLWSF